MAALRPRVLYVDDEPRALSALMRIVESRFQLVTSDDAVAALSLLERDGDFAVAIADVSMPKMNGFAFLDQVRVKSPTTTRLALTGLSNLDSGTVPIDAVFRVLRKPCPSETLFAALTDAVDYHELLMASPVQPVESSERRVVVPEPVQRDASTGARAGQRALGPSARIGLRVADRTVELLPGATVLGRSRTCHIPIDDPKVSRRHACFTRNARTLSVCNLSGTNPVLLNGLPLGAGEHALQVGDRVSVGVHQVEVCTVGDYLPSFEPTEQISGLRGAHASSTQRGEATLVTLADVAEKYLRLGHGCDAERILRPLLEGLLRFCRSGQRALVRDIQLALELALGLAEAERSGAWINYVFELLTELERPPEHEVLERLYRIAPLTPGISMTSYRIYVEALLVQLDRFGPAARFLVRRLQGLDAAILRSAHV